MLLLIFPLSSCVEMQQVINQLPQTQNMGTIDISAGLKEALNNGISKQVSKLTAVDGFYRNEAVKILLPEELKKVDSSLRKIGLGSLADEGLKVLNRAAEDAVKEATPIFVDAVKKHVFRGCQNHFDGQRKRGNDLFAKHDFNRFVRKIQSRNQKFVHESGRRQGLGQHHQ